MNSIVSLCYFGRNIQICVRFLTTKSSDQIILSLSLLGYHNKRNALFISHEILIFVWLFSPAIDALSTADVIEWERTILSVALTMRILFSFLQCMQCHYIWLSIPAAIASNEERGKGNIHCYVYVCIHVHERCECRCYIMLYSQWRRDLIYILGW